MNNNIISELCGTVVCLSALNRKHNSIQPSTWNVEKRVMDEEFELQNVARRIPSANRFKARFRTNLELAGFEETFFSPPYWEDESEVEF